MFENLKFIKIENCRFDIRLWGDLLRRVFRPCRLLRPVWSWLRICRDRFLCARWIGRPISKSQVRFASFPMWFLRLESAAVALQSSLDIIIEIWWLSDILISACLLNSNPLYRISFSYSIYTRYQIQIK